MPKLKTGLTASTRHYLPSGKDATNDEDKGWVELKNDLQLKDLDVINAVYAGNVEATLYSLSVLITDWNFYDENNEKAPINPETINLAFTGNDRIEDWNFVCEKAADVITTYNEGAKAEALDDDEKKASSSSSSEDITPSTPTPSVPTAPLNE
jgi:hypothetical protein